MVQKLVILRTLVAYQMSYTMFFAAQTCSGDVSQCVANRNLW